MFRERDREEELRRLEQQLLEEDDIPETDEELLDDIGDVVDDVQNGYEADAYNSDDTDLSPEELQTRLNISEPEGTTKRSTEARVKGIAEAIIKFLALPLPERLLSSIAPTIGAIRIFTAVVVDFIATIWLDLRPI